jgi:recombination protein RecT
MAEMVPIQKRIQSLRDFLERQKGQFALALPRHLTPERLIRVVLTECIRSAQHARPGAPTLFDCTLESFAGAVLQVAQLGLEPGVLGQAYLIPFRNLKRGTVEVQLIPGYKGLLVLARRSGQIVSLDPVVVHAKDTYRVKRGTAPAIVHEPYRPKGEEDDAGPAVAYYAIAFLRGGGVQFESMWRREVEVHRQRYSRAAEDGPWATNFDEMALKTVLRRLCKWLPLTVEAQTAIALDERAEAGLSQDLDLLWSGVSAAPSEARSAPASSKLEQALEAGRTPAPPEGAEGPAPSAPSSGPPDGHGRSTRPGLRPRAREGERPPPDAEAAPATPSPAGPPLGLPDPDAR